MNSIDCSKNLKRKHTDDQLIPDSGCIKSSKRFRSSCNLNQPWVFMNPIIRYIFENCSSKVYEKLIKSCKYFFFKNPVLVMKELNDFKDTWISLPDVNRPMSNINAKIWITKKFAVMNTFPSSIITKFYRLDVKELILTNITISFFDLLTIIPTVEDIKFEKHFIIKDENDSNVGIEKIVAIADKAQYIDFEPHTTLSCITSNTMKELLKLPNFLKLHGFYLHNIPDTFDLDTFIAYLKQNNNKTYFIFYFDKLISEEFQSRLGEIVDDVISTQASFYKFLSIFYRQIDAEKLFKLNHFFHLDYFD